MPKELALARFLFAREKTERQSAVERVETLLPGNNSNNNNSIEAAAKLKVSFNWRQARPG